MTTGTHAAGRDDVAALRDAVRELLARECPPEVVRAGWPGGDDAAVSRSRSAGSSPRS